MRRGFGAPTVLPRRSRHQQIFANLVLEVFSEPLEGGLDLVKTDGVPSNRRLQRPPGWTGSLKLFSTTRTRTNTNPNGTEANAAGRSARACDARK